MDSPPNRQSEPVGTTATTISVPTAPDSLREMFLPGCQLGLEDLKALGVSLDVNPSGLRRLTGDSASRYRDQPRAFFPVWFDELLVSIEQSVRAESTTDRHDRLEP